jgi:predicted dehydrogenase
MPGVRVVGLSDPVPGANGRAAAVLPSAPELQTTDYRQLLDGGLDAVCLASPDGFHVQQVLAALAANLHVLCEKPLTPDPAELEAVIAAKNAVGKIVSMTYPRRYDAGIRAIRREILSGQWGRVKTVTAYNAEDWITPNRGTWRHDPELCPGGFFYDASGHQLDTLMWVTGLEATVVSATSSNRGTPVPIVILGRAQLTDFVPMTFTFVGDAHTWREQCAIHCEGMDFIIENGKGLWVQDGKVEPVPTDSPDETADEAFVKYIRGEGPNWAPTEELWPVLRFTRAALRSAASGEPALVDC